MQYATMSGSVELGGGVNALTNSGSVGADESGRSVVSNNGTDTVTNLVGGVMTGAVEFFGNGANKLTNNGTIGVRTATGAEIGRSYWGDAADDTIFNTSTGAGATYVMAVMKGGINAGNGTNALTNSGLIGVYGAQGLSYKGGTGADAIVNSGTLNGGVVVGDGTDTSVNSLSNTGRVGYGTGGVSYVGGSGIDTVTNGSATAFGVIQGAVNLDSSFENDAGNTVSNFGGSTIGAGSDFAVFGGGGKDTVVNGGTLVAGVATASGPLGATAAVINGLVNLSAGTNKLTNFGTIGKNGSNESYIGGNGADTVINAAAVAGAPARVIQGSVAMGDGANVFSNLAGGTVGLLLPNFVAVSGGADGDTITNNGSISGTINLGDGTNTLTNTGSILNMSAILGGSGVDTVTNSGSIGAVGGNSFDLGGAADKLTNFVGTIQGTINGTIDMGAGADTLDGGTNVERVIDNNGADRYNLSGGNDVFFAYNSADDVGEDAVYGGAGNDTYDATGDTSGYRDINIDTVNHTDTIVFVNYTVLANTAVTEDPARDNDRMYEFENASGSERGDNIFGSDVATAAITNNNVLKGNGGGDVIFGYGGNDTIDGGSGGDHIVGGLGKDYLTGGTEGDTFYYMDVAESTMAARDVITDFVVGPDGDVIDLSRIDAISNNAANTNDAFTFLGTNVAFTGVAGQLLSIWTGTGQLVMGDVNGDRVADFAIELAGIGTVNLGTTPTDHFIF